MENSKYSNSWQRKITDKLINNFEEMDEDEFEASYNKLNDDYQSRVDAAIREFTDAAIGSENWDSDE